MGYFSSLDIERENYVREYYTLWDSSKNAHMLLATDYGYIYADNPDYEVVSDKDLPTT